MQKQLLLVLIIGIVVLLPIAPVTLANPLIHGAAIEKTGMDDSFSQQLTAAPGSQVNLN